MSRPERSSSYGAQTKLSAWSMPPAPLYFETCGYGDRRRHKAYSQTLASSGTARTTPGGDARFPLLRPLLDTTQSNLLSSGTSGAEPAAGRDRRVGTRGGRRHSGVVTAGTRDPRRRVRTGMKGSSGRRVGGSGAIGHLRTQAQRDQYGADRLGIRDGGDQPQPAAAVRTGCTSRSNARRINWAHAHPRRAERRRRRPRRGCRFRAGPRSRWDRPLQGPRTSPRPPATGRWGREYPVIEDEADARPRSDRSWTGCLDRAVAPGRRRPRPRTRRRSPARLAGSVPALRTVCRDSPRGSLRTQPYSDRSR